MADILRIERISKTFEGGNFFSKRASTQALKDVSFTVQEAESFALTGPSGCGKSTLAKIILGLEKADSGKIFIDGEDISLLKKNPLRALRAQVQIVFQDPYSSLDPRMIVKDILEEPFLIHKLPCNKDKINELLETVGLPSSAGGKYPYEFSGGQRQRIAIARALALSPRVLIADEAVSALDVSIQAQILNLFKQIKEMRNLTLIFISHDLALCKFLCTRAAVLYNGALAEIAPVQELFSNPKSEQTKRLLAAAAPLTLGISGRVDAA